MDDLKKLAAPKTTELIKAVTEQNELLDVQIVLLDRLCTLKEAQQEGDDTFRDSWKSAKMLDTRVSLWVLVLANAALYLDVIEINSTSAFVAGIFDLFS